MIIWLDARVRGVGGGDGVGCRKTFARNWSPDTTMATVLGAVYCLLLDPEPKDPLDSRLAELFLTDRLAYINEVEDHTRRHAAATAYENAKNLARRPSWAKQATGVLRRRLRLRRRAGGASCARSRGSCSVSP